MEIKELINLSIEKSKCSIETTEAISFIDANYNKIKHVKEIAEELNINYHTLRDKFRRETRYTLINYLHIVRLKNAVELLKGTNDLIKEIAWEVGYENEGHLTRIFQQYANTTPQLFRVVNRRDRMIEDVFNKTKKLTSSK